MSSYLDQVPFDIVFYIASHLHLDDVVHLAQTCSRLYGLLDEPALYRSVVEKYPHTKEAILARSGQITFKEALRAIYDRRQAFSNASPFSVRILGEGNTFVCRQGTICVLKGDIICVSDLQSSSDSIQLELSIILRPLLESTSSSFQDIRVSLLYYSDRVLSLLVESDQHPNTGHIFAISTAAQPPDSRRVLGIFLLESTSKLFVRHTSRYLFYGTHTGLGDDDHHKWEITGVSLDKKNFPLPRTERPLLLENFHGTDIGSTVSFEIHDNYFWAVSNQGTYEVEEVDWTSFYHCVRFPLDDPTPDAVRKNERVYRRQHAQGPIHDSWTDLSLQPSEETNEMMIVESRREWAQASSRQSRTFYVSAFKAENSNSSGDCSFSDEAAETLLLPEDDIFVGVIDSTNKPNYMPTPPQYSWGQHPEFARNAICPRTFTLSKTKFRAYNYSCSSFLDLVEDEKCCNDLSKPPCLRLRVGSRREAQPDPLPELSKGKGRLDDTLPIFEDKQTRYHQSPIRMWPPPASQCPCSKRLHDIMNPPLPSGNNSHSRTVIGVLDDRSFIYMVKPGRSYGASDDNTLGTIVVVDFTRSRKSQDTSTSSTASLTTSLTAASCTPVTMIRKDSVQESTNTEVHDRFDNKSVWTWSPGYKARCKNGTCH